MFDLLEEWLQDKGGVRYKTYSIYSSNSVNKKSYIIKEKSIIETKISLFEKIPESLFSYQFQACKLCFDASKLS